jgi:adenine-specific DNA-methyltransferase
MKTNSKYDSLSREQLIDKIQKLEKEQYGLVWEDKEEDVEKRCDSELPLLKEDSSREIVSDPKLPYNIIIEGDNYHSLYALSFTHKKSIDVIYIDPPYNTGKKDEWKYNDRWVDENDKYRHSKWLSFMSKRLRLARNLLTYDGIIFISIDEHEFAQLKLLCDSVFGENNYIATLPRITKKAGKTTNVVANNNDFVLVYCRNKGRVFKTLELKDKQYKHEDEYVESRGKYKLSQTLDYSSIQYSPSLDYEIELEGETFRPGGVSREEMISRQQRNPSSDFCWRWSRDLYDFGLANGFVVVKRTKKGVRLYTKTYQNAKIVKDDDGDYFIEKSERTKNASTLDLIDNVFSNDNAKKEIDKLFGKKVFEYTKPTSLVYRLAFLASKKNSVILDFFAGSGTTGHAVLKLNKSDEGCRKFILCTNNENNVCTEVTYPRIKKVIEGYSNVQGIPANVKYYTQTFVPVVASDNDKRELVNRSTEILCVAEGCFEMVHGRDEHSDFAIYRGNNKQMAIIYDEDSIADCVDYLNHNKIELATIIYVFSYDHTYDSEDFESLDIKFSVKPIPEAIINVYRKISKMKKK